MKHVQKSKTAEHKCGKYAQNKKKQDIKCAFWQDV